MGACERPTGPATYVYTDRPVQTSPSNAGWATVETGARHSCALTTSGGAFCWGSNTSGQLGVGTARGRCTRLQTPCEAGPRAVSTPVRFAQLSVGDAHVCAVALDRSLWCWGDNLQFQTSFLTGGVIDTPMRVGTDLQVASVGAGATHTCAVRTDGVVLCWGEGRLGALGRGDTVTSAAPLPITSTQRFVLVRSGRWRSCAIDVDGAVWCWGAEWERSEGALEYFHQRLLPHRIAGLPPMAEVSVGALSICGVARAGQAWCWEANGFGQLGTGRLTGELMPVRVASDSLFRSVSVGLITTCGLAAGGTAYCWGNNSFGQVGVPRPGSYCGEAAYECSTVPLAVFGGLRFGHLVTSPGDHSCGVTQVGALFCWGIGGDGQLGDGWTRDRQSLPVNVLPPAS